MISSMSSSSERFNLEENRSLRSFWISTGIHILFLVLIFAIKFYKSERPTQNVNLEVYELQEIPQTQLQLQPRTVKPETKPKVETPEKREVFGLSRKSIESASENAAVQVKAGNTIAKEMDDLKLNKDDADSIPIPVDDYLVTAMPVLLTYFKPQYTNQAKSASIEGVIIVEIIVDDTGKVRDAKIVRGLGYGLDEETLEAVRKAQFRPGRVGEKPVAVKFRYKYKFELEN